MSRLCSASLKRAQVQELKEPRLTIRGDEDLNRLVIHSASEKGLCKRFCYSYANVSCHA